MTLQTVNGSARSSTLKARLRHPMLICSKPPVCTRRSIASLVVWNERPASSAALELVSTGAAGRASNQEADSRVSSGAADPLSLCGLQLAGPVLGISRVLGAYAKSEIRPLIPARISSSARPI